MHATIMMDNDDEHAPLLSPSSSSFRNRGGNHATVEEIAKSRIRDKTQQQGPALTAQQKRKKLVKALYEKVHAAIWVFLFLALVRYTKVFEILLFDQQGRKSNRFFTYIAAAGMGVVLACFVYLSIYLPYIKRIKLAWEVYCPNVIPVATAAGTIAFLSFVVALWPSYGFFSPAIVLIIMFAPVMSLQLIPWCC